MAKLVVSEFVTLDGVMEDPGGAEGFDRGGLALSFDRGADGDAFKLEELMSAEAMLRAGKRLFGDGSRPRPFTVVATKPAGATVLITLTSNAP